MRPFLEIESAMILMAFRFWEQLAAPARRLNTLRQSFASMPTAVGAVAHEYFWRVTQVPREIEAERGGLSCSAPRGPCRHPSAN